MALEIRGKTALITGGGSGIGLELARRLVSNGCNVVVADLALGEAAKTFVSDESSASFIKTDVTHWDQLQASFDHAIEKFGHLDIVFPGAGIFDPPVRITSPAIASISVTNVCL